jgi:hypothetical protein
VAAAGEVGRIALVSVVLSSCMVETMMPMKRFRMVNVAMTINGTKNVHAHG